jgi:hypothetical protein
MKLSRPTRTNIKIMSMLDQGITLFDTFLFIMSIVTRTLLLHLLLQALRVLVRVTPHPFQFALLVAAKFVAVAAFS